MLKNTTEKKTNVYAVLGGSTNYEDIEKTECACKKKLEVGKKHMKLSKAIFLKIEFKHTMTRIKCYFIT